MTAPIYLDFNATTPVDGRVADAIHEAVRNLWGNPSSAHSYGAAAMLAIDKARQQVAALIGAEPDEIVFTGGGSEASNHAIMGSCLGRPTGLLAKLFGRGMAHIVTGEIEHPATLAPIDYLKRLGASATVVGVDGFGRIDPAEVLSALKRPTRLVSIMHSNNEVGTLQPIRAIAEAARAHRAMMHTDAAQSLGKVPVNVNELGVDLLTVAGHKLYAPKGIGALFVRRGVKLESLIHGADHESGRRAGTENVPYIVGLGLAAEMARSTLAEQMPRLQRLRDRLHLALRAGLGDRLTLNGHPTERLPNTLNVNFPEFTGAALLAKLPGLAASTGAACHEKGKEGQSPVLCAMKVDPAVGIGAVRFSVGRTTTDDEIDRAAALILKEFGQSPEHQPHRQ